MKKKGTLLSLQGLSGQGDFEVRPAKEEDNILVTIGRKRTVEFNVRDRQVIKTYFAPSHIKLSSPIAYDKKSKNYVCIANKTSLFVWNGEETRLEAVKSSNRLYASAVDCVVFENQVVVVFDNGDVQPLDYIQKSMGSHQYHKCDKLISKPSKSRFISQKGSLYCAHILSNSIVSLYRLSINASNGSLSQAHVKTINLNSAKLLEIVGQNLVYLGQDSQLKIQSLLDSSGSERTFHFEDEVNPLSISQLDETRAVVVCTRRSERDGINVRIIDILYDVTVQAISVKTMISENLCCFDGKNVLFRQGNAVVCWCLEEAGQCLADLVGSAYGQVQSSLSLESDSGCLTWQKNEETDEVIAETWLKPIQGSDLKECSRLVSRQDIPSLIRLAALETLLKDSNSSKTIRSILNTKIDKEELLKILKQMEFEVVKKLLEDIISLTEDISSDDAVFDTVLMWMEALLETHYTTFVVTKDTNSIALLEKALTQVTSLDTNINLLASVMAQTEMMKKKQALKQARNINLMYSIEIVHL